MNTIESTGKIEQGTLKRPLALVVRILAGIVRWTWRLCSLVLIFCSLTFIGVGFSQGLHISSDPGDLAMMAAGLIAVAGLILAWWREGLGGLIVLLVAAIVEVMSAMHDRSQGRQPTYDAANYAIIVLPLAILLSWSLHASYDDCASPKRRLVAQVTAPFLAIAISFLLMGMFHAPFNP